LLENTTTSDRLHERFNIAPTGSRRGEARRVEMILADRTPIVHHLDPEGERIRLHVEAMTKDRAERGMIFPRPNLPAPINEAVEQGITHAAAGRV
jgi:hypothetical protein